ncbi:type II and III secretion system protein family protein [Neoroseomonas soli]|uniref:BON domain-containing protein n=1 Tax=Neoroseomonas soli TaxID=1081025 RepID=A0A9X9X0S2_9PROT|nr:type II and III secretion system protein family protein [Neoroseomonas soli]MBR0673001.1 BON domain-containing protein [Neoroseomonas soli]
MSLAHHTPVRGATAAADACGSAGRGGLVPVLASFSMLLLAGVALPPAQASEPPPASAAGPQVGVRTGSHPGYGRVVFDWPSRTAYEAETTGNGLVIRFTESGRIALPGGAPRNVLGVTAEGDSVRITAREGARFRHFHHGPKLVVDILDPAQGGTSPEPMRTESAPTAEGVLADLAAATRLPPPARAGSRPAVLASAAPSDGGVSVRSAVVSDAPLAVQADAPAPAVVRMAQSLPPSGPRMSTPLAIPVQSGLPIVGQAQAQPVPTAPAIPGMPQVMAPQPGATLTRPLVLEQGAGRLVELPAPALTVLVADPRIARVQPASPTSLFIMGVNAGRTNLIATREDGSLVAEFDITVQSTGAVPGQVAPVAAVPAVSAGQVQSMIRRLVRGGQNVRVSMVGRGAIALSGMVPSAADAQRAEAIAKSMGGEAREVINNLTLLSGIQVNLRVRVAEISREITRDLGFNWLAVFNNNGWTVGLRTGSGIAGTLAGQAVGGILGALNGAGATTGGLIGAGYNRGSWDINGLIDALAQDRLVTILAEPNLTAQSGEVASFLAGGEFPVPMAASNNSNALTVEYKQFGVSLAFIPTVLSPERLNMRVRPEVSELSESNSVVFPVAGGTVRIPGLTVRRAETTIEVGSGQSFAIAGLLSRTSGYNNNGISGLADIPILGTLFRSDRFRRNETELVIIITPYLVRPVSDPQALATPLDSFRPATDLERVLLRRQTGSGAPYRQIRPPAAAGFIVE